MVGIVGGAGCVWELVLVGIDMRLRDQQGTIKYT